MPCNDNAPVAQLDRASDSDSEGRAFESHQAYHLRSIKIDDIRKSHGISVAFCIHDF